MKWFDRHLVPYWRKAPRMFSVQAITLQTTAILAWSQLPSDLKEALPHWLLAVLALLILSAGVIGALIPQRKVTNVQPPKTPEPDSQ